jgi:hypothetical protein
MYKHQTVSAASAAMSNAQTTYGSTGGFHDSVDIAVSSNSGGRRGATNTIKNNYAYTRHVARRNKVSSEIGD